MEINKIKYVATGLTLLLAIGMVSCDSRTKNQVPSPNAPSPIPSAAGVSGLDIVAPPSIAPGETVQLTASAKKTDNSIEVVSSQGHWYSQDPGVLDVSGNGMARAVTRGEAIVRLSYGGWGASAHVFVMPPDTYRLIGTVTDSGLGIAGVTLTVIGGVGENQTATTDGRGVYALYGVRDRVRLQAKAAGYLNRIEDVDVRDHRAFDFEIIPEQGQRTDLRGRYTLTIRRMACPGTPLPETRTYDATVTQDGPRLTVRLSGADFRVMGGRGDAFKGFVDAGNHVTFPISNPAEFYDYGPYDLMERVAEDRVLFIKGTVTAALSPSGISGTLSGGIVLVSFEPYFVHATCYGTAHGFEMVRR